MKNLSGFKSNGYALFLLFSLLKSFSVLGGYDGETLLNNEYNEHEFLAACRTGNVEAVQYFLDQDDFDPNEQLISGLSKTPVSGLFLAAQNGHHTVVEILIFGLLKSFSVLGGYDGATLLNNEYKEHEFLAACRTGNVETVQYFIERSAQRHF